MTTHPPVIPVAGDYDLPSDNPLWTPGIDLSAAQRKLTAAEWSAVYNSGVRFAYAKAAEATYPIDDRAIDHAHGANDTGILFDMYGYLHSNLSGRLQAESWVRAKEAVLASLHAIDLDLRFMIDFEDQERIKLNVSQALDVVLECGDTLMTLTGEKPLLYTGPGVMNWFRGHLDTLASSSLYDYDVEIAHYRFDPATGKDYHLRAPTTPYPWSDKTSEELATTRRVFGWQWGGNRCPRIKGVPFDLDLDVYFGSVDELRLWGDNKSMTLSDLGGHYGGVLEGYPATLLRAGEGEKET